MTYSPVRKYKPRSALLTLFGDYGLRNSRGEIGIGSLITLLGDFGLSEQAIRCAISRMCRAGIIEARRVNNKSFYSLTAEGRGLLESGKQRIFDRKTNHWSGMWSIVMYSIPENRREVRNRFRQELEWLGYGSLCEATWISPNNLEIEVEKIARKLRVKDNVHVFTAKYIGLAEPGTILERCWDLKLLNKKYEDFINKYRPRLEAYQSRLQEGEEISPRDCFVARFELIHEYRRFPFFDPDIPVELLPANWPRLSAAGIFHTYHSLLTDKANEYFDSVVRNYHDSGIAKNRRRKPVLKTG